MNRTVATQLHGSGGDPCQGTVYWPVDGGPGDLGSGQAKERLGGNWGCWRCFTSTQPSLSGLIVSPGHINRKIVGFTTSD